jgi:methyl-accepting chemotaxis protein
VKLTLFRRLLVTVCGVAAASTGLTLAIQERTLSNDLRRAAVARLETSATAAEGLVAAHLRAIAERYRSIAATSQFRATLEVNDVPTLTHYAGALAVREGAAQILFVDPRNAVVSVAGTALPDALALDVGAAGLLSHDGRPYAAVSLPLESPGLTVGRMIAVEPVSEATVGEWSKLCGARVVFVPAGADSGADPERRVLAFGSLELHVVSSLDSERAALAGARLNLLAAGSLGLAAAFAASVLLSRQLVRPILELQAGASRIGRGDLTVRFGSDRRDEMGDAARAFEGMASGLRETVGSVAEAADRVEATSSEIGGVMERLVAVVGEQMRASEHAAASMEQVNEQVRQIADSAARSALALEGAIDGSSLSFRELASTGEELGRSAAALSARVDEISASLAQSVENARQVSQIRQELVSAAAETRRRMAEMAAAAQEVNANADRSASISSRMIETAEQGRRRVLETVDGMKEIRDATEEAQRAIGGLDQRVTKIGAIVSVIDDVTDETSLLALNAAIIAAQSGESGRAFAVVAAQMKAVANRVLAGTREIHTLVRTVQEESANATEAIERGSESVASGVGRAEAAGVALEEITAAARDSGARMGEIVASTSAQNQAAADVLAQTERVRGAAESLRVASDEQDRGNEVMLRSATELRGVATDVRSSIESQGAGAARIGSGIAMVRESMESINRALSEQSEACRQGAALLASTRANSRTSEESVRRMSAAIVELLRQAELLRRDVSRFRMA